MTERGMIFNAEMVRAILDGRKMQTRRMLTPRHLEMIGYAAQAGECYPLQSGQQHANSQAYYREWCPFGQPGDRIWVRETWTHESIDAENGSYSPDYRATANGQPLDGRWTPSIHMPRWASRITLEVTDVRVERLSEISEADAAAEGVPPAGDLLPDYPGAYLTPNGDFATAKVAFQRLWESIYGKDSWQANPWVWVIEFRRVEGGEA